MKCYYCDNEASTKVGTSKGNLISALFGLKCWEKTEVYLCVKHYLEIKRKELYDD